MTQLKNDQSYFRAEAAIDREPTQLQNRGRAARGAPAGPQGRGRRRAGVAVRGAAAQAGRGRRHQVCRTSFRSKIKIKLDNFWTFCTKSVINSLYSLTHEVVYYHTLLGSGGKKLNKNLQKFWCHGILG